MTIWLIVEHTPRGIPYADAFTERTYDLIEDFEREHVETDGPPLLPNAMIIASDLLLDTHGPEAAWDRLDLRAFLDRLGTHAPDLLPYAARLRATLLLFLEHLVRRGTVPPEVARRARAVPAPREGRNRAERRFLARQARRRGPSIPAVDDDVRVLLPRDIERVVDDE
jgi:hypothetical protein